MEETVGSRISEMRTEQALETESSVLATACPFCLQMFEDGIKAKEASETIRALDIAELVAQAIDEGVPAVAPQAPKEEPPAETPVAESPQEEPPAEDSPQPEKPQE